MNPGDPAPPDTADDLPAPMPVGEQIADRNPELERSLREDTRLFSFFQMMRLLLRQYPDRKQVGGFVDPADEVARFVVEPVIAFPPSEIRSMELQSGAPSRMAVDFMGLTGPQGLLPFDYTLLVADRVRSRDYAMRDFLDIFHHRIISLFYRAWEKNRFYVAFERQRRDPVMAHVLDLVGLGLSSTREAMAVPAEAGVFFAGLLAPQQRSAVALEQLLEDYFRVSVEVEQFVGGWYALGVTTQCRLGHQEDGASAQLGLGAVAGDEIWDQQARVRIRLGPLSREQYDQFLPTGDAYLILRRLVRFYSNDQFDYEIQLVLTRDDVPGCVIGAEESDQVPLGWCTWMRTQPIDRDPDEAILTL